MGILDTEFDPTTQGLLAAAFAGLQASGPQRMPTSLGQIIGQAGSAGLGQYGQAMKEARQLQQAQQLIELEKQKAELTKAQIEKMRREAVMSERLMGLLGGDVSGEMTPDKLDQLGTMLSLQLHPGGGILTNLAERRRKEDAAKATMATLQSQEAPITSEPTLGYNQGGAGMRSIIPPGPMVQPPGATEPIPPEVAAASAAGKPFAIGVGPSTNPAENVQRVGGLFSGDIASQDPVQAQQGLLGQRMVDVANPRSVTPQHFIDAQGRIAAQAAARQQQQLMAQMAVANRAPQAGVAVVGPDGKPVIVPKGEDIGMTPASAVDSAGAISPQAIEDAAARYNLDGTLPPMGMGKAASEIRSKILNRAAEMKAPGVSGEDQRIGQLANKANAAALSKIQQQATMVGAFERNFTKNTELALEYSTKTDKTGVPIVNKWINAGKRAVTGDPQLSAYDAVIKSVVNEYTKIISGSMGNQQIAEGEIKKIENLLTAAQTPEQVKEVITLMRRETQNRMKGFEEEKEALRNSMKALPVPTFANEPKPKVSNATDADIKATALKYGVTVDEVKRRLGLQ